MKNSNRKGQSAFTLIELLISLVIGITVSGVAFSVMVSVMSSRDRVSGSVALQEADYFVSQSLRRNLAQAGYRGLIPNAEAIPGKFPILDRKILFPAVENDWESGQIVKFSGQSLSVRYGGASIVEDTPDGSIAGCLGVPLAVEDIETMVFSLIDNELTCSVDDVSETMVGGSDSGVRVENMVVELGVDDDSEKSVDRYLLADTAAVADFLAVKAIKIRLLLASADNVVTDSQSYTFNGESFDPIDRRIRRESVISVSLRN